MCEIDWRLLALPFLPGLFCVVMMLADKLKKVCYANNQRESRSRSESPCRRQDWISHLSLVGMYEERAACRLGLSAPLVCAPGHITA